MKNFILELLAFVCIISSIFVITARNPVIAVIYLISVFISAACYLLISGISFIGLTYLLLYVGAITILFLFVIMSINIKLTDIMEAGIQYTRNIPLALSIGIFFIYELLSILPNSILSLGTSFGFNFSVLKYPIKLFKWINDQFIPSNLSYAQTQIDSMKLELDKMVLDLGDQKIDPLASVEEENLVEIENIYEIKVVGGNYIEDTETLKPLSEKLINFKNDILILIDYNNITDSSVPVSEPYNEHIDGILSDLIQLSSLGQELYTHGVSWLMICGIILLLSLLCPTIITRSRSPKKGD